MSKNTKILILIIAIISIVAIPSTILFLLEKAYSNSYAQIEVKDEKEKLAKIASSEVELNKTLETENTKFGFSTKIKNAAPSEEFGSQKTKKYSAKIQTNFGDIMINMNSSDAPKTIENFVRLISRKSLDDSSIHRIVVQPNFAVIQGGDFDKKNGQGGKSAFFINEQTPNNIPDELWTTKPVVNNEAGTVTGGKFSNPDLYTKFDSQAGSVEYKKGLILMAKTSQPDSASSQFFITLGDTVLPAQYTVFGVIDQSSTTTLDKILAEVKPVKEIADTEKPDTTKIQEVSDGKPSKPILFQKSEVKVVQ